MLRVPPRDWLSRILLSVKRRLPRGVHSDGAGRKNSIRSALRGLEDGEIAELSLDYKDFKANSSRTEVDA